MDECDSDYQKKCCLNGDVTDILEYTRCELERLELKTNIKRNDTTLFKSSIPQHVEIQKSDADQRRGFGGRLRLLSHGNTLVTV
jgi:hypothetical protein